MSHEPQRARPPLFSQIDVSQTGYPPVHGGRPEAEQTRLLRELLAGQDRQNELLEELVNQFGIHITRPGHWAEGAQAGIVHADDRDFSQGRGGGNAGRGVVNPVTEPIQCACSNAQRQDARSDQSGQKPIGTPYAMLPSRVYSSHLLSFPL